MGQEILTKIQELPAKEQQKILDFVEKLLKEQAYQQKITLMQKAKQDALFQTDLQNIAEDFKYIDR